MSAKDGLSSERLKHVIHCIIIGWFANSVPLEYYRLDNMEFHKHEEGA